MKKTIVVLLLILIVNLGFKSTVLANTDMETPKPANIKVLLDGKIISFDQEPVILKDRVLVPIRKVAELMGANVLWTGESEKVVLKKDNTEIIITIGEPSVLVNRQIFFMDQPPVVVNDRTLVPLRFVSPALGARVDWDDKNQTVLILSQGNFSGNYQSFGDYYKLFDVVAGEQDNFSPEEAKQYALKHNLLKYADNVRIVYTRFNKFGPANTMVSGLDIEGNKKVIWFSKNPYLGTIEVVGSVLLVNGVQEERIYSTLNKKGIKRECVKDLYLAIEDKKLSRVCWYALAHQNQKEYNYLFDFKTGELISEYQYDINSNIIATR